MDQAGLVLATVAGLWLVYLVPQLLQDRRRLAEARVDDRFSEHLRVLRAAESVPAPAGTHAPSQSRVQLHPRGGDRAMYRPQSVGDRVSADAARLTAAERAARAAALARRAAATRRRALLVAVLLLATAAGWVATAQGLSAALGATPAVLLVAVLVAGRSAVLAARRADAAWAAGAARRAARPRPRTGPLAVGRAAHPSEAVTEILQRVPVGPIRATAEEILATGEVPVVADDTRGEVPASRAAVLDDAALDEAALDDAAWVPVPVPVPTYTLKPAARRAEPRPLTGPQPTVPVLLERAAVDVTDAADAARPTTGGLQLDAILARRRASGE
jgi:hypothetical protein